MQEQLDPDTLLLEYSLAEERSYLWLVSQSELRSYELPGQREIEKYARDVYNLLTSQFLQFRRKRLAKAEADR